MKFTSRSKASLKNLFLVILTFAMASILLNLHTVRYTDTAGSDAIPDRHGEFARHVVGGSDIRGFGRSLNQHPDIQSKESDKDVKQTLLLKLLQVEERLRRHVTSPAVALLGSHGNEEAVSSVTLKDHRLHVVNMDDVRWRDDEVLSTGNWSLMFCSDVNNCPTHNMHLAQKADVIPELVPWVDNPKRLCDTARRLKTPEAQPPCCEAGVHEDVPQMTDTQWWAELKDGTGGHTTHGHGCHNESSGLVLWRLPSSPLMYDAGPLLRLQCLVTSWLPLRFYVSSVLQTGPYTAGSDNTRFKKTSVGDILQYISESYGLGTSGHWWSVVQDTLLRYLATIEGAADSITPRCRRCFHVVNMDVVCQSIGQCSVIKITDGRHLSSDYYSSVLPVISMTSRVAVDVSLALEAVSQYSPIELCTSGTLTAGCLTEEELIYAIDDRSETANMTDWIKIYPSCESHVTGPTVPDQSGGSWVWRQAYRTHDVRVQLQKYYKLKNAQNHEFTDRDSLGSYWKYEDSGHSSPAELKGADIRRSCSLDNSAYGKITAIGSSPSLAIAEVAPGQFYANVSYSTILVTLWTSAAHCRCDVRLENKYNTPGSKNIILGLGETGVRIYVVDKDLPDPSVVNVVMATIYRRPRGAKDAVTFRANDMTTCALKQECSLRFIADEKCGLQDLDLSWSNYKMLPWQHCNNGDSKGQWVVPCSKCSDESTCSWSRSKWQPDTCSYKKLSNPAIKQCFAGKKILFIGDSTNRGILNYILDHINGSLWDWDKTHTIKVYTGVNSNSTVLSFAYYPHFWLPADHRPKFHKVIYQLMKSSLPLENNSNTVLVIGGVQWLARQHIDYITEALHNKGLSNITVLVKGLGAGFHQRLEGVRFLPGPQHAQLAVKEREVLDYARQQGMRVVATFNMTMARYRDFLEGTCACHFHKVTKSYVIHEESDATAARGQYSVTGEINAAYSDIVIDQICR